MGRIILILLAVLVAFMIISFMISALHFVFWLAVLAVITAAVLRLGATMRRWSRR